MAGRRTTPARWNTVIGRRLAEFGSLRGEVGSGTARRNGWNRSKDRRYYKHMIPNQFQTLFWDTNVANFNPSAYPDYTIMRVLEFGDDEAIAWLREMFSEQEIRTVLCTERRLSPKS